MPTLSITRSQNISLAGSQVLRNVRDRPLNQSSGFASKRAIGTAQGCLSNFATIVADRTALDQSIIVRHDCRRAEMLRVLPDWSTILGS